ncbi:hypothetical protein Bequi_00400 [Brachybacterium sp. JHP9]|uniref:XRE family transcriptional regulator n=1 Tax=Brachybacterium equifaecis TaxID=2910770 RepID=A0ABT0QW45_9MICO|nr:hypothetical protein [Brachybacterium equifaecis]MCL6421856.1 hypothetical protein [Brachybacterium equifaecis]
MGAATAPSLPEGDFATRLSAALESRGLGLARVSSRLRLAGAPCAASTLSNWRSGHTRPRRPEGVRVVLALETILETPPGYLVEVLLQAGSRRRPSTLPSDIEGEILRARAEMGLTAPDALQRLLMHEVARIDAQGRYVGSRVRSVVRGTRSAVERVGVTLWGGQPCAEQSQTTRSIRPLWGAQLGRSRLWADHGVRLVELVLEAPIEPERLAVIEYEVLPDGGPWARASGQGSHEYGSSQPVEALVLEMRFDPAHRPARLTCRTDRMGEPQLTPEKELAIGADGSAVCVLHRVNGGGIRAAWDWEG